MHKISCIVAAYNEGTRIGAVLSVLSNHPHISEIIVVNDGSTDNTKDIVASYPNIISITQPKNMGKSTAIYTGIQASQSPFVMFIDADLVGLTQQDITKLIEPVIRGNAAVSISLRGNTAKLWRLIGLDYISGERVIPRALCDEIEEHLPSLPGFGLEVFQNRFIIKHKYPIAVVSWPSVSSPWPHEKRDFWKGVRSEINMVREIMKTISPLGPLYQIWCMYQLKKNYE